jgi:hypothetical protein
MRCRSAAPGARVTGGESRNTRCKNRAYSFSFEFCEVGFVNKLGECDVSFSPTCLPEFAKAFRPFLSGVAQTCALSTTGVSSVCAHRLSLCTFRAQ